MDKNNEIFKRYKDLEIKKKEEKEKEYPEIAWEVGKFVREVGMGMWHCSVHKLPVSPLMHVFMYTMDGQKIAVNTFGSSCFRRSAPSEVTKNVIEEIGGYAAQYLTIELALRRIAIISVSSNPSFWVVLGIGVLGATAPVAYSTLVDLVWKISSDRHKGLTPIYATPNLEDMGFASYTGHFRKVRTIIRADSKWGFGGEAEPADIFSPRRATRENYVGITSDDFGSSFKWLIKMR